MDQPSFKHPSWDDYDFWQTAYFYVVDGSYRNTLQNAITSEYKAARADLDRLLGIEQQNPLATKLANWHQTLRSYCREITCDEAANVLSRLEELRDEIEEQWDSDERDLRAGRKHRKGKAVETPKSPPTPVSSGDKGEEDADDGPDTSDQGMAELLASPFGQSGHSRATTKSRPPPVKGTPTPPPTAAQIWNWAQEEMEQDCSDTIPDGEHDAAQSVLDRLNIHGKSGTQARPAKCKNTNSETRIIFADGRTFWIVGLSHMKRRTANNYVAYERTGKNTFTHVSGKRIPRDPAYVP